MPGAVTIPCPAKVNLALAVGPVRDDGYHPIVSWMVALSFADELAVERLPGVATETPESAFDLAFSYDAPVSGEIDWPLADDLMFRAHRLVEQRVGRALPVRVTLRKRIPTGAGLGGGSSDAAGIVVALDQLFDLGFTAADHHALSADLGSDVHFAIGALTGTTSAIVSGLGDQIEPAPAAGTWPIDLVLVLPPFGCPTGKVYAAFDQQAPAPHSSTTDPAEMRELVNHFSPPGDGLFNDLSDAAARVQPGLASLLEDLRRVCPHPPHVTGSGAACFIVTASADEAHALAEIVRIQLGVAAIATKTC